MGFTAAVDHLVEKDATQAPALPLVPRLRAQVDAAGDASLCYPSVPPNQNGVGIVPVRARSSLYGQ